MGGNVPSRLASSIDRAKRYLLDQAAVGFPEARHTMRFPRQAGFTAASEEQSTDVFTRAVLASVLLDAAERDDDVPFRDAIQALAHREAEYVAAARLHRRAGGWSYFPGLPELPPDLDSLSAALLLFARAAPERTDLCAEPVALALGNARPDGSIATWLISPRDDPADRRLMELGVSRFWGDGSDVDVCAHFYFALWTLDRERYGEVARRGARHVEEKQLSDGSWEATWYHGRAYGTALCLRLLRAVGTGEGAVSRAADFLSRAESPDPQDTALALWAAAIAGRDLPEPSRERAITLLLDRQTDAGHWSASPWIKMDVGRAAGVKGRILTYGSATLTTAFCLRALLDARRRLD